MAQRQERDHERGGADPARQAAHRLMGLVGTGVSLAEAAPEILAPLAPPERARAQRLASGALRWADRADRMLGPRLRGRPDPAAHDALRLALYEIFQDGAAAHGAVGAAVDLARAGAPRQAGLVNAVLRALLRDGEAAAQAAWDALPLPQIAKWLRKPLVRAWGKTEVAAMEAIFAETPPIDLTPRDGDAVSLAARLEPATAGRAVVTPTGSLRLPAGLQVSALPGYDAGDFWVQDMAAALPARLLGAAPGQAVLDLCAAPGGKTLQLAAAGADVTALDLSEPRLARLRENLARCGLAARVEAADALHWTPERPFDAILLDAPCSATGTLRRHPELPRARAGAGAGTGAGTGAGAGAQEGAEASFGPEGGADAVAKVGPMAGIAQLVELQARLIDRALDWLAPGGRLVFATCSLLPEEGEAQVTAALERHPGLTVDSETALALPGVSPDWASAEGGLRMRPDLAPLPGGMDGFYMALLRKA